MHRVIGSGLLTYKNSTLCCLPYDDTMIYIFVCVCVRDSAWGGGGGGGGGVGGWVERAAIGARGRHFI